MPIRRLLSSIDNNMSPQAKAAKIEDYGEDERDELEGNLRQKIKSLQHQLHRSKQKVRSLNDVVSSLAKK